MLLPSVELTLFCFLCCGAGNVLAPWRKAVAIHLLDCRLGISIPMGWTGLCPSDYYVEEGSGDSFARLQVGDLDPDGEDRTLSECYGMAS